jgi:hypothetical protein
LRYARRSARAAPFAFLRPRASSNLARLNEENVMDAKEIFEAYFRFVAEQGPTVVRGAAR